MGECCAQCVTGNKGTKTFVALRYWSIRYNEQIQLVASDYMNKRIVITRYQEWDDRRLGSLKLFSLAVQMLQGSTYSSSCRT